MAAPENARAAAHVGGSGMPGAQKNNYKYGYSSSMCISRSDPVERSATFVNRQRPQPQHQSKTFDPVDVADAPPPGSQRSLPEENSGHISPKWHLQHHKKTWCPSAGYVTAAESDQGTTTASAAPDARPYPGADARATGTPEEEANTEKDLSKRLFQLQEQLLRSTCRGAPEEAPSLSAGICGGGQRRSTPATVSAPAALAGPQPHEKPVKTGRAAKRASAALLENWRLQQRALLPRSSGSSTRPGAPLVPPSLSAQQSQADSHRVECDQPQKGERQLQHLQQPANESATATTGNATVAAGGVNTTQRAATCSSSITNTAATVKTTEVAERPSGVPWSCPSAPAATAGGYSEKRLFLSKDKEEDGFARLESVRRNSSNKFFSAGAAAAQGKHSAAVTRHSNDGSMWDWPEVERGSQQQDQHRLQQHQQQQGQQLSPLVRLHQSTCRPGLRLSGSDAAHYGFPAETSPPLLSHVSSAAPAAVQRLRTNNQQPQLPLPAGQRGSDFEVLPVCSTATRPLQQHRTHGLPNRHEQRFADAFLQEMEKHEMEGNEKSKLLEGKQPQPESDGAAVSSGMTRSQAWKGSRSNSITSTTQATEHSCQLPCGAVTSSEGTTAARVAASAGIEQADVADEHETFAEVYTTQENPPQAGLEQHRIENQQYSTTVENSTCMRRRRSVVPHNTDFYARDDTLAAAGAAGFVNNCPLPPAEDEAPRLNMNASGIPAAAPVIHHSNAPSAVVHYPPSYYCYYHVDASGNPAVFKAAGEAAPWPAAVSRLPPQTLPGTQTQHQQPPPDGCFYVLQQHPQAPVMISETCPSNCPCYQNSHETPCVYYPATAAQEDVDVQQGHSRNFPSNPSVTTGVIEQQVPLCQVQQQLHAPSQYGIQSIEPGTWVGSPAVAVTPVVKRKTIDWGKGEKQQFTGDYMYCSGTGTLPLQHAASLPYFSNPYYSGQDGESAASVANLAVLPRRRGSLENFYCDPEVGCRHSSRAAMLHTLPMEVAGADIAPPAATAGIQALANIRWPWSGTSEQSRSKRRAGSRLRRAWCCSVD